jgi:hypothetical protein
MYNLSTIETHDSAAMPGIKFRLKRITEPLRQEFRQEIANFNDQLEELGEEATVLETPEQKKDPENRKRLRFLNREYNQIIDQKINPAWIKSFLVDVSGLTVGGDELTTPDQIINQAPQALYAEILSQIKERAALGGAEVKNSESASTSSAPVDGPTASTTA